MEEEEEKKDDPMLMIHLFAVAVAPCVVAVLVM